MRFKRYHAAPPRVPPLAPGGAIRREASRRRRIDLSSGPRRARRPAATAVALAVLLAPIAGAGPAAAQVAGPGERGVEEGTWLPARTSFAPLLAAPREVSLRGSLILADRPDLEADFEGRNLEAEVALGHRFAVVRLQRGAPGRPEITLGFEVGAFSRFHLETPERDLIGVDYRVGLPLSVRGAAWEARLAPVHESAHIGDDFLARFDAPGGQFTRDGVELALARRVGPIRLYGTGTWNFHVNPGVPEGVGAFGVEWDPRPLPGAAARTRARRRASRGSGFAAWPFAAVDLRFTERTRGPGTTGVAGAALRVGGTVLRLELRGHTGPTALGQLRGTDETFLGLGLRVEP